MASRPQFVWLNGSVVPMAEARISVDDRAVLFSESLYEVVPITAGRPRLLPEHVARMERAARELGLQAGVPGLARWEAIVHELVRLEGAKEALLYAQVTGGAGPREFVPAQAPSPTFFAYATHFSYPKASDVERGIRAVSLPDIRWGRRDLKTTMLLGAVLAKREARRAGADEAVLVGASGHVHEGASSNVYLVEDGDLVTPTQSTELLPGTMRPFVGELAEEAGLRVRSETVSLPRLASADEIFVTSTSQLLMPVVSLDDRPIGHGRGGPVATDIARRLRARFELSD